MQALIVKASLMSDPAASGQGILTNRYFKRRGKPRGIKPTGGIQYFTFEVINHGFVGIQHEPHG
jgi:hypothetical protein